MLTRREKKWNEKSNKNIEKLEKIQNKQKEPEKKTIAFVKKSYDSYSKIRAQWLKNATEISRFWLCFERTYWALDNPKVRASMFYNCLFLAIFEHLVSIAFVTDFSHHFECYTKNRKQNLRKWAKPQILFCYFRITIYHSQTA